MAEYIEREAVIEEFVELQELSRKRVYDTPTNSPAYMRYSIQAQERDDIVRRLMAFPAADVRHVVLGKWIECISSEHWKCSICGERAPQIYDGENMSYAEWLSPFCPNCGTEMREEDNNG